MESACLFQEYQKMRTQCKYFCYFPLSIALFKHPLILDVSYYFRATFGVFAPYAPTDRMRSVFGDSRLESFAPTVRLQVEEEYDLRVLKAIRVRTLGHIQIYVDTLFFSCALV